MSHLSGQLPSLTTTTGGKIIGFGDSQHRQLGSYDRHVYMDNSGRIIFGVYPGAVQTVHTGEQRTTTASGTTSSATLSARTACGSTSTAKVAASRHDVTGAQDYSGFWRVGGDNLGGWTNQPSSNYFTGSIDDVAIYPTVLDRGAGAATTTRQSAAPGRSRRRRPTPTARPSTTTTRRCTGGWTRPAEPRRPTRGPT